MKQYQHIRTAVRFAFTAGFAASLSVPAVAGAQNQVQSPAKLGKINVTGTRIKRTNIVTAQPITNISHQQLEKSGLKSIGQILNDLPSVGFGLGVAQGSFYGSGEQAINLRFLGYNRVLTLLNGKRLVKGFNGSVDLTQIPISAVDHIEILQDGASAVYGSDAITGVVNIITKKNFNGAVASAYYGIDNGKGRDGDQHWDGQHGNYNITLGLSNDKGHLLFTGQYRTANEVPRLDRAYAFPPPVLGNTHGSPETPQGDFNFIAPTNGNPNNPGNHPAPFTGLTSEQCPTQQTSVNGRSYFLPNCNLTIKKGTSGQNPANYRPFTPQDRYVGTHQALTVAQDIKSVYTEGSYNLTPSAALHASALYTDRQSTGTQNAGVFTFAEPMATIAADNPYNPFGFTLSKSQPTQLAPGLQGTSLRAIYRRSTELGLRMRYHYSTTFRFTGGFDGNFNLGQIAWNWNADYIYSRNYVRNGKTNVPGYAQLPLSLATSPQCPKIATCVPLNLFGGQGVNGQGTITPAQADYIRENTIYGKDEKVFHAVEGTISSSDIFDLPGGPLGIAAGYQHRSVSGKSAPGNLMQFPASLNPTPPKVLQGGYHIDAVFGELDIPVLNDFPGADYLGVDVATRYSDYSTFGSTVNTRVGVKYQPIEDLVLRSTYAEGFRAANINELFEPKTTDFPHLSDPCSNYTAPGVAANIQQNCKAKGVPASYRQLNSQFRGEFSGNASLDPETTTSRTLGLVYSPGWLKGLSINADYYNIQLKNTITTINAQTLFDFCYRQSAQKYCNDITRGKSGFIRNINLQDTNLGGTNTAGFDVNARYKFPSTPWGDFSLNLGATHVNYYTRLVPRGNGTTSVTQVVGNLDNGGTPEWQAIGSLNWAYGGWSANVRMHYLSDFTGRCSDFLNGTKLSLTNSGLCSDPNFENNDASRNHVGAATWYDVRVSYATPWNVNIALGARNIFEKKPPAGSIGYGFIPGLHYDLLSRFLYGQISYAF